MSSEIPGGPGAPEVAVSTGTVTLDGAARAVEAEYGPPADAWTFGAVQVLHYPPGPHARRERTSLVTAGVSVQPRPGSLGRVELSLRVDGRFEAPEQAAADLAALAARLVEARADLHVHGVLTGLCLRSHPGMSEAIVAHPDGDAATPLAAAEAPTQVLRIWPLHPTEAAHVGQEPASAGERWRSLRRAGLDPTNPRRPPARLPIQ